MRIKQCKGEKLLKKELKGCFNFFNKEINLDKQTKGYGLIRDKFPYHKEVASVASVGYGFASLIIGVEHKWLSYEVAYERANHTLDTFLYHVENIHGFFYHFVNIRTAKREWNSELSIIDTAIFICGALTIGEYFGGEIKQKAEALYNQVDWDWYRNKQTNQFYMGYTKEKGFWGKWDMYGEQLMLYVLSVASKERPVSASIYEDFEKRKQNYQEIEDIIFTYCGTLFTYQFSHAWIDFRNLQDKDGIDWFENSIKATKAAREYCIQNKDKYKTYGENSWGLTSCIGPDGYKCYGAKPCLANLEVENDGTIPPCGAIGSIVFTPKESIEVMEHLYHSYPKLWSKYGFLDAYNLEKDELWVSKEYIGIDKGICLIMIENYLNRNYMEICYAKRIHKKRFRHIRNNKKTTRDSLIKTVKNPTCNETRMGS